jgi:TDG/mug DNA glycosylase family protein
MKSSFPPVVDENTSILILGSLPGEESLRQQKYYANPRNDFWPILFRMFDTLIAKDYEDRLKFLKSHRIGLWDVIHRAERIGSLDSNIRNATANDFESLFENYPHIKMLAFNGRKSENTFRRMVLVKQKLPPNLLMEYFPSTSPAHKYISVEDKYLKWSILRKYIEAEAV